MTDEVFQGLPVCCCFPGSLSDLAGVRQGDVILCANGVRIDSLESYVEARARNSHALALTLLRGSAVIDVTLDLRASENGNGTARQATG